MKISASLGLDPGLPLYLCIAPIWAYIICFQFDSNSHMLLPMCQFPLYLPHFTGFPGGVQTLECICTEINGLHIQIVYSLFQTACPDMDI